MHAKTTRYPAEVEQDVDRAILTMLLADPTLWAVDEVRREIANPMDADDGLARLYAAGLVHRVDGEFVIPTRAAMRSAALGG